MERPHANDGQAMAANGSDLPQRFLRGDHDAVEELLDAYGKRLLGYLRTMLRSQELAEDVLQDVLLAAYTKRGQLKDPRRLEQWLFALARNAALTELARARHRHEVAEADEILVEAAGIDPAPGADRRVASKQAAALLDDALRTLDPKRRELMALRYFSDLSLKEIADVMQMPMGSVGTTLMRTLELLRARFAERGFSSKDLLL